MTVDRYQIVGNLTRAQAEQVAELLAGGSVIFCGGHAYPGGHLWIRPTGCECKRCEALCTSLETRTDEVKP